MADDPVLTALRQFAAEHPQLTVWRVAVSGGRDSMTLADACTRLALAQRLELWHVHHGLQSEAERQAAFCQEWAQTRKIPCVLRRVQVPARPAEGIEACARRLRYAALAEGMDAQTVVLTAQHANDQAETVLLAALKGSGPQGLAAMPPLRPLGQGWLGRPLLTLTAQQIADYAADNDLRWVDDPSNADLRFDRNWLRAEIVPRLQTRFPAIQRLGTVAHWQAEVQEVLNAYLDQTLDGMLDTSRATLSCSGLLREPSRHQLWLLRRFLQRCGAEQLPRREPLQEFLRQIAVMRPDRQPELSWTGGALRIYRDAIYWLQPTDTKTATWPQRWYWPAGADAVVLPHGQRLSRTELREHGLAWGKNDVVYLALRRGGERLQTTHGSRSVKKLLQEHDIPPWQRGQIPLFYVNDHCLAIIWPDGKPHIPRNRSDPPPLGALIIGLPGRC